MDNPQADDQRFDVEELERLARSGRASIEHITTWDPAQPDQAPPYPNDPWPEPEPLTARIERQLYPEDALPSRIYAAAKEVQGMDRGEALPTTPSGLCAVSAALGEQARTLSCPWCANRERRRHIPRPPVVGTGKGDD